MNGCPRQNPAYRVTPIFFVILSAVTALASFSYTGHILLYAPRAVFTSLPCYSTNYLEKISVCSALSCPMLALLVNSSHILLYAPFFVILQVVPVLASLVNPSHILLYAPRDFLILPPWHNSNYLEKTNDNIFLFLFLFFWSTFTILLYQTINVTTP